LQQNQPGCYSNLVDAGNRLMKQVKELDIFDELKLFSSKDLKEDSDFWSKNGDFISKNNRGYGYWIWKAYVVKKTLEKMQDGDILLYLDAGCEIDIRKKSKLEEMINDVKMDYIIGSLSKNGTSKGVENKWNKMDLILYLDMNDEKYLNTSQRQAGVVLYYKNSEVVNLVNEWYNICCNYHMIDNSPSIEKNLDTFIEHRHDQSIFSLLTKKYNIFSKKSLYDCIEIIKNRTGKSLIKPIVK